MIREPAPESMHSKAHHARLRRLEQLEYWLDRRFKVPFLRIPVGVDGILGLVPGVGDTVAAALSAYLILEAHRAGADRATKIRMIRNTGLDYLLGLVPVVGSIADFFYKANTRNLRLLKEHLASQGREAPAPIDTL
jgi:hypothetical protein